jgi:hypothetical protein
MPEWPEELSRVLFVVPVLRLQKTLFYRTSQLTEREDRKEGHPHPLIGAKRLIERLPSIG